jgi:hypothetical protein
MVATHPKCFRQSSDRVLAGAKVATISIRIVRTASGVCVGIAILGSARLIAIAKIVTVVREHR